MAQHLRIRRPNGRLSRRITRWLAPLLVAMSSIWFLPWRAADAAAPTFVQQAYATPQTALSTVTATYSAQQRAGDTNVIAVGWNDVTATVTSLADTSGNS